MLNSTPMQLILPVILVGMVSQVTACTVAKTHPPPATPTAAYETPVSPAPTSSPPIPTKETTTAIEPATQAATMTPAMPTPPRVEQLAARVTARRLSCRYGPGAEYLYLYGLREGANIKLVGRTDGNNWVWVEGRNRCWVNARFIDIEGDQLGLPVVYPEPAHLPRSPYYPPTAIRSAVRSGDSVTVEWLDIPLRAGDEEDESMLHYIVEVWRCENGQLLFDPLATNDLTITFTDQPGCSRPSHGRVFVQEKHGFAGPAEIPWPEP